MGEEAISEEDKWMLEVDTTELRDSTLEEQQLWLHAIEAARQAGTRALELTEGATNDWNNIIRDGKFSHLPTTTPISTRREQVRHPPVCQQLQLNQPQRRPQEHHLCHSQLRPLYQCSCQTTQTHPLYLPR